MAQLRALYGLVPADVRPLIPVVAATALGVLLLLPSAVLRAFLLGMLAGPVLLAGIAAFLVLSLVRSAAAEPIDSMPAVTAHAAAPDAARDHQKQLDYQRLLGAIGHDMAQASRCCLRAAMPSACRVLNAKSGCSQAPPGEIPPYPIWQHGQYRGWLWTVDPATFDTSQTLANWPPSIPGSCKWWALLQGRRLVLACRPAAVVSQDGSALKRDAKAAQQSPSKAGEEALIVKEINLEGCSVEVLKEAIQGRSRWLRKAPLCLAHAQRPLLGAQRQLLLFAAGSAAKEQWFTALSSACAADGGAAAAVEALYETFCDRARANAAVPYPQMHDAEEAEQLPGRDGKAQGQKRWLARWLPKGGGSGSHKGGAGSSGHMHRLSDRLQAGAQRAGRSFTGKKSGAAPKQASGELPERKDSGPAPVMNPMDLDSMWMGGRQPQAAAQSADGTPTSPTQTPSRKAASTGAAKGREEAGGEEPGSNTPEGTELREMGSAQQPMGSPLGSAAAAAERSPSARLGSGGLPHAHFAQDEDSADPEGLSERPEDYSSDEEGAAQPLSPSKAHSLPAGTAQSCDGVATAVRSGSGGSRGARVGRRHRWRQEAAAQLPAAPVEAAANMLLARAGFDLLRSGAFKERVAAHIRRKLALQRVPDYITSLEVVDVDLGSSVPTIANLRALPCPTDALWPQVVFDLDYPGGLTVIIEARVDLRDSTGWDTLDRAITRLGGAAAGAAGAAADAGAAAAATAAAAAAAASAVSPADSDEEDTAGEGPAEGKPQRRRRFGMGGVRSYMATRIRSLAEATAEQISKMHLRVRVDIHSLQGTVCAWVPPPPNDRLWFGFVSAPELRAEAAPLLSHNIGAHMLLASYRAAQVPAWVGEKLQSAIGKNLTLPSCADIPLPHLLPVDAPAVAEFLPAFLESLHAEHREEGVQHEGETAEASPGSVGRKTAAAVGKPDAARSRLVQRLPAGHPEADPGKAEGRAKFTLRWPRRKSGARDDAAPSRQGSAAGPLPVHGQQDPPASLPGPALPQAPSSGKRRSAEAAAQEPNLEMEMSAFSSPERGEEMRPLHPLAAPVQEGPPVQDPLRVSAAATVVQQHAAGSTIAAAVLDVGVPNLAGPSGMPHAEEKTAQATADSHSLGDRAVAVALGSMPGGSGGGEAPVAAYSAAGTPECAESDSRAGEPAERHADASLEHQPAGQEDAQAAAADARPGTVPGSHHLYPEEAEPLTAVADGLHARTPLPDTLAASASAEQTHSSGGSTHASIEPVAEEDSFAPESALLQGPGSTPAGELDPAEGAEWDDSGEGSSSSAAQEHHERGYVLAEAAGQPAGGEPGASPSGKWRELGGAMGKKYLEAFKSRKELTYAQGKKMAEKVAGQAQKQMRKALAARERAAAKQDKRA